MGKLQKPCVHLCVTPFLIGYNYCFPNQSTCGMHHLKGPGKFYLDHKKVAYGVFHIKI